MYRVLSPRRMGAVLSAVLSLGLATGASAVSLDIRHFSAAQAVAAQAELVAFQAGADGSVGAGQKLAKVRTETFGGHQAWNGAAGASNPDTAVGAFTSLGGHGTGAASINGGTQLQVRNDNPWTWGRFNTSSADRNWLDSNDTLGMRWDVGGLTKFNALAFLVTDVADVGAKFSIKIGETVYSQVIGAGGRLANGSIHLVRILLPEAVDSLVVELRNDRLNDGFGVNGATVARIAPVPAPPALLLLLSGGAAIAALRRRRKARAA